MPSACRTASNTSLPKRCRRSDPTSKSDEGDRKCACHLGLARKSMKHHLQAGTETGTSAYSTKSHATHGSGYGFNRKILQLAQWAMAIEDHYSSFAQRPTPMDIEWAKDGVTGELFIVQARPETVHSQQHQLIELYCIKESRSPILTGKSVGTRVAAGPVRVVHSSAHMISFKRVRSSSPR